MWHFFGSYKKFFQRLELICLRFVKIPVDCSTFKFECLNVESLIWDKLGADSLCSELLESCVMALELFVLQGVANFCYLLN